MPECIGLDRVTVRFGRHHVLRDVSLVVPGGECVCVRGANGAGKTTLLRLVAGAIIPTRGVRRGPSSCAYVPPALAPPSMSVAGWLRGVRRTRIDDPEAALATLRFDVAVWCTSAMGNVDDDPHRDLCAASVGGPARLTIVRTPPRSRSC